MKRFYYAQSEDSFDSIDLLPEPDNKDDVFSNDAFPEPYITPGCTQLLESGEEQILVKAEQRSEAGSEDSRGGCDVTEFLQPNRLRAKYEDGELEQLAEAFVEDLIDECRETAVESSDSDEMESFV